MWPKVVNMDVDLFVINTPNDAYNAILGRTSLNKAKAIILTLYLLMNFLMLNEIDYLQIDQVVAKSYYMANQQDLP